jgi:hypothetical protein
MNCDAADAEAFGTAAAFVFLIEQYVATHHCQFQKTQK